MNMLAEALRHSIELAPRIRQLVAILRVGDVARSGATLTGLSIVAELRGRLQRVEDALTLHAAGDKSVPVAAYAEAAGMTANGFRRRVARLQAESAPDGAPFVVGETDGKVVRMAPGSHLHVAQRGGVRQTPVLDHLLTRLKSQADQTITISPEVDHDIEGDHGASVVSRVTAELADSRALVIVDGVEEETVETFLGALEADVLWNGVTLVWVDRRSGNHGTAVTTEAALGHVALLSDDGGSLLLGGLNGPGLEVDPGIGL